MIVTVTYKEKTYSKPLDGLRADDLLCLISTELSRGREIHITPEQGDLWEDKFPPISKDYAQERSTAPGEKKGHQ